MKKDDEFQGSVTLNSTVQDSWEDETLFKNLKYTLALLLSLCSSEEQNVYPFTESKELSLQNCLSNVTWWMEIMASVKVPYDSLLFMRSVVVTRMALFDHTILWILCTLKLQCICKDTCSANWWGPRTYKLFPFMRKISSETGRLLTTCFSDL